MPGQGLDAVLVKPILKAVVNHIDGLCVVHVVRLYGVEEGVLNVAHAERQPSAIARCLVDRICIRLDEISLESCKNLNNRISLKERLPF